MQLTFTAERQVAVNSNLPQETHTVKGGADHSAHIPQESEPPPATQYAIVSAAINSDKRLFGSHIRLLIALYCIGHFTKTVWLGRRKIAVAAGVSEKTAKTGLRKLIELGYISIAPDPHPTNASWRTYRLDWLNDPTRHPQRKGADAPRPNCTPDQWGNGYPTSGVMSTPPVGYSLPGKRALGGVMATPNDYDSVGKEELKKEREQVRSSISLSQLQQAQQANSPLKANSESEARASGVAPVGKIHVSCHGYPESGVGHYNVQRKGSTEVHRLTHGQLESMKRQCAERGGSARMDDGEIDRMVLAVAKEAVAAAPQPPKAELETQELSKHVRGLMNLGLSLEAAIQDEKRRETSLKAINDPEPAAAQSPIAEPSPEQRLEAGRFVVACLEFKKPELGEANGRLARDGGLRQFMLDQGGNFASALERLEELIQAPTQFAEQAPEIKDEADDEEDGETSAVPMPLPSRRHEPLLKAVVDRVISGCNPDLVTTAGRSLARAFDDDRSLKFYFKILGEVRAGKRPCWHVSEAIEEALESGGTCPGRVFTERVLELQPLGKGRGKPVRQGASERWG